jgi:hypothetical protein
MNFNHSTKYVFQSVNTQDVFHDINTTTSSDYFILMLDNQNNL